jgi:hypothetical protein
METIIITLDNNKKKEYVKGIKLKEIIEQEDIIHRKHLNRGLMFAMEKKNMSSHIKIMPMLCLTPA